MFHRSLTSQNRMSLLGVGSVPATNMRHNQSQVDGRLNSSDVAGPVVYTAGPVATAFSVAPVAGVPDETRSGVAALVNYFHERNDDMKFLRVALSRRAAPLTQAVVFDANTSHPMFNEISGARGVLVQYVSTMLATLDDGTLEMECDGLRRACPGFVENLITVKWDKINWFNDVLRGIVLERCKSAPRPLRSRTPPTSGLATAQATSSRSSTARLPSWASKGTASSARRRKSRSARPRQRPAALRPRPMSRRTRFARSTSSWARRRRGSAYSLAPGRSCRSRRSSAGPTRRHQCRR